MSSPALDTVNGDEDSEDRPGDDHCGEYEYGESITSIPEFNPYLVERGANSGEEVTLPSDRPKVSLRCLSSSSNSAFRLFTSSML